MSCSPVWTEPYGEIRRRRLVTSIDLSSEQSTEVIEISPEPSWLSQCLAILARFEKLPQNWDGYNSPPIAQCAFSNARQFLTTVQIQGLPAPAVLPVSGGGIGMNWVSGQREVELTLLPNGDVEFLQVLGRDLGRDDATREGAWQQESFSDKAKEMLEWLIHG